MAPTYEQLTTKNPEYDAPYWDRIRTFAEGMVRMRCALAHPKQREDIMPRKSGEEDFVYEARVKNAFYIPYMGNLIDTIVATLFADPVRMSEEEDADDPKAPTEAKPALSGNVNGDPFYDEFYKDCSHPGGPRMNFNQLLREQINTALLCKRAWALCELPNTESELGLPHNRLEEEREIADQAWAVPLDPDSLYDWEFDDDGELVWACVCVKTRKRAAITDGRNMVREEFTVYTADGWQRHIYTYDPDKKSPTDKQEPDSSTSGKHSFGRVPLVPLELPSGLWAGGKLESIAREHFNKENALGWAQDRSLFQFLQVKLGAPDMLNPITEDADRGVNQVLGPGRVMRLGDKDDASYVGPDAAPFEFALTNLNRLRDEMHRVLSQMANSVDNSGAALKRSGESKAVDAAQSAIILKELGHRVREHAEDIYEMIARGRGEDLQFAAGGMDNFDEVALDSLVNEAAVLVTVPIPSPTFQALYKFELARRLVPGATEEQLADIQDELVTNHTAEAEMADATRDAQADRIDDGVLPGESPPEPAEDKGPPAKKKKKGK